jgi:RNA polymerase sigma factor (sigma-70 family)
MKVVYNYMDKDILQGCRRGERLAQKKLYEKFYSKMMSVCMRYANSRDEAATILNEGFYKVFMKIEGFVELSGNLEAWIYRIMINTAIDHYRKEAKTRKLKEFDNNVSQGSDNFDIVAELSAEDIIDLVQKLPMAYRTVFNLHVIEGMTHKEIAEQLGISEGTSKSNLFKARGKLQVMIDKKFSINYRLIENG